MCPITTTVWLQFVLLYTFLELLFRSIRSVGLYDDTLQKESVFCSMTTKLYMIYYFKGCWYDMWAIWSTQNQSHRAFFVWTIYVVQRDGFLNMTVYLVHWFTYIFHDTRRWPNVVLVLVQRWRRCANIMPAFNHCLLFAGIGSIHIIVQTKIFIDALRFILILECQT